MSNAIQNQDAQATLDTTTLDVQGMTCGSCVRHVSHAVRALDGVADVDVKLREGIVTVRHDAGQVPVTSLIEALRQAGYESQERR
jgi:copper chaperone